MLKLHYAVKENSADGEFLEGKCLVGQVLTCGAVMVGELGGRNPDKNTISSLLGHVFLI